MRYKTLAIDDPQSLVFGAAPRPVTTRRGLVIGGGTVYPELNFTLPPMEVSEASLSTVLEQYRQIIRETLRRAGELEAPGVVVEFETLPPMTENPSWALAVVEILLEAMDAAGDRYGLRTALRITPNDNREMVRPPKMRTGRHWDSMLEVFERSASAGAELLSIESTGGKEIHDGALLACDLRQSLFSLCVLGVRDMQFLWRALCEIAGRHGAHPAGDTACGFGNTAMVLAEQGMIPRVFAACVRAVSTVRSLVAYECGAVGPGKDCGYENPFLKAITGCPMSMEGKSAACAHLSPLGNIAAASCDLWSNESVQNVKLLGAMAPVVSMEQLVYDCRLFNQAAAEGQSAALTLRRWLVDSDVYRDPQAVILHPENVVRLARAIVAADDYYGAGVAAAREALSILRESCDGGPLRLPRRERSWLERLERAAGELPDEEAKLTGEVVAECGGAKFLPAEYGL